MNNNLPSIYDGNVPDPNSIVQPQILPPPQHKLQMPSWKDIVNTPSLHWILDVLYQILYSTGCLTYESDARKAKPMWAKAADQFFDDNMQHHFTKTLKNNNTRHSTFKRQHILDRLHKALKEYFENPTNNGTVSKNSFIRLLYNGLNEYKNAENSTEQAKKAKGAKKQYQQEAMHSAEGAFGLVPPGYGTNAGSSHLSTFSVQGQRSHFGNPAAAASILANAEDIGAKASSAMKDGRANDAIEIIDGAGDQAGVGTGQQSSRTPNGQAQVTFVSPNPGALVQQGARYARRKISKGEYEQKVQFASGDPLDTKKGGNSSNLEEVLVGLISENKRGTGTPEDQRAKRARLTRELGDFSTAAETHKQNFFMYKEMDMKDEAKAEQQKLVATMKKKSEKAAELAQLSASND